MSEPREDLDRPGPVGPTPPRREVPLWEYSTAYRSSFQVRLPAGLHERLCRWAGQVQKPPGDLLIEILEEEILRRGG